MQGPHESDQLVSLIFFPELSAFFVCLFIFVFFFFVILIGLVAAVQKVVRQFKLCLGLPPAPLTRGFLGDCSVVSCGSPSGPLIHL